MLNNLWTFELTILLGSEVLDFEILSNFCIELFFSFEDDLMFKL